MCRLMEAALSNLNNIDVLKGAFIGEVSSFIFVLCGLFFTPVVLSNLLQLVLCHILT